MEPPYTEIRFKPALKRGEKAEAVVTESYGKAYIAHKHELLRRISAGELRDSAPWERASVFCVYPARRLLSKLSFPPDYEPEEFDIEVTLSRAPLADEIERVNRWFTVERDSNSQWTCRLDVERPLTGAVYSIRWIPPEEPHRQGP